MFENISFKPVEKKNLEFISEVYNIYISNSTSTYHIKPLSKKEVEEYFMLDNNLVSAYIIDLKNKNIGFCLLKPYNKHKEGYDHTYEISIYLKKEFHKKGVGIKAVEFLEHIAKGRKMHAIIVGICTENIASNKLFEKCGYQKCGFFKEVGFKFNRWLDTIYYQKLLKK